MRGIRFALAGVLAVGMVAIVHAQGGGFGGGPTFLVSNKAVQEDLKLTEEQATKLKDWGKEFGKKAQEIYKEKGVEFKFGTQPTPEQREKMAAATAEVNKLAYKELGDILKKEQVERVKQIARQQMNVRALTDAEVVAALKLSDSQKSTVKGITGDYDKEAAEIRKESKSKFGLDDETRKKLTKLQKEAMGKFTDALDDGQKTTWKGLIGESFDLSKLQFNFTPKKKD